MWGRLTKQCKNRREKTWVGGAWVVEQIDCSGKCRLST